MKYGIAIVWDGPELLKECNDRYLQAMLDLVAREMVDINRHFEKHGLRQLNFTLYTRNSVDHFSKPADY